MPPIPSILESMDSYGRFAPQPLTISGKRIIPIPRSMSEKFPSRGIVLVSIAYDDVIVPIVLEPDGWGSHWFEIPEEFELIQEIEVLPASQWPEPMVPEDVLAAFRSIPSIYEMWEDITAAARWDWLRWIRSTSNAETRKKRISAAIDKMKKGERRPCCFNRNLCTVPEVSKSGKLLEIH
jgi:hypothetical protein